MNYSTLVTGVSKRSSVHQSELEKSLVSDCKRNYMLQNTSGVCFWKKIDPEDEILMMVYLLMRKRRNHQQPKKWSEKYFSCITRCHSLSLVVIPYHSLNHSLSLDLPLVCLFINDPFFTVLSNLKFTKLCLFIHFRWIDVKSNRCFGGLSLISIILWEYCENNIKTFWYYSYENKRIISRKAARLFFLRLFEAFPPIGLCLFS